MLQETNGDTSRDLRLDSDDIADPINDRLTLAERNERLQGQLKSLKDELATTRQVGSIATDLSVILWGIQQYDISTSVAKL